MAALDVIYGESEWGRIVIPTMTNTEITAISTKVDFLYAVGVDHTIPKPASSSTTETKYFTRTIANGNRLSVVDNSKNINLADGSEISEDTTAEATYGTMTFKVTASFTQLTAIRTAFQDGVPVFGIREIGKSKAVSTNGGAVGYDYIFGKITDYKEEPAAEVTLITFTITGSTFGTGEAFTLAALVDYEDFNAVATGATATITPAIDGVARTITAITATEFTDVLGAGQILRKAAV